MTGREVFSNDKIRLYHSDVMKVLDELPTDEIQAVITSPVTAEHEEQISLGLLPESL